MHLLTVFEDCYFLVVLTLVFTFASVLMGMKTPIKGLCLSVYFSYFSNYFYYWWKASRIVTLLSACSVPTYHTCPNFLLSPHTLTGSPHNHEQPLSGVRSLMDVW